MHNKKSVLTKITNKFECGTLFGDGLSLFHDTDVDRIVIHWKKIFEVQINRNYNKLIVIPL